jgi:hypothetical protein
MMLTQRYRPKLTLTISPQINADLKHIVCPVTTQKTRKALSHVFFTLIALFADHITFAYFALSNFAAGNASLMPAYVATCSGLT